MAVLTTLIHVFFFLFFLEQREQSVPFDYSSDIIITVPSSSQAVSRPYRPRSAYPSTSQRQQAPFPSTSAAYKPETSGLDAPPPSYQDYARDVQLVPRS
ncbi:hypothetical protein BC940DRAFT_309891 [Gongronella butleri]|nr:hypothetical protein BC940DRAFT_309891 [Gongronella butleri]